MADLRAFTLHRVWAGMVACGWKPYLYRNVRPVACIGQRVAIHAGHSIGNTLDAATCLPVRSPAEAKVARATIDGAIACAVPGHIVCTALVGEPIDLPLQELNRRLGVEYAADALRHLPPGYERVHYAIPLLEVHRLPQPVPCRGSQTLGWRVPDEVAARVRAQEVSLAAR